MLYFTKINKIKYKTIYYRKLEEQTSKECFFDLYTYIKKLCLIIKHSHNNISQCFRFRCGGSVNYYTNSNFKRIFEIPLNRI